MRRSRHLTRTLTRFRLSGGDPSRRGGRDGGKETGGEPSVSGISAAGAAERLGREAALQDKAEAHAPISPRRSRLSALAKKTNTHSERERGGWGVREPQSNKPAFDSLETTFTPSQLSVALWLSKPSAVYLVGGGDERNSGG